MEVKRKTMTTSKFLSASIKYQMVIVYNIFVKEQRMSSPGGQYVSGLCQGLEVGMAQFYVKA